MEDAKSSSTIILDYHKYFGPKALKGSNGCLDAAEIRDRTFKVTEIDISLGARTVERALWWIKRNRSYAWSVRLVFGLQHQEHRVRDIGRRDNVLVIEVE
jgi:hypothetical protein